MAAGNFEDRFFLRETPAWHRLGTVVPKDWRGTVKEAFRIARADYELFKAPVYATLPDGQRIVAPDRALLVRLRHGDTPAAYLSDVHKDYPILQNMQVAESLEVFGRKWPVETVCCLRDGAHIVVTFKLGTHFVGGRDEVKQYRMFSEWRGGDRPAIFKEVDMRVVCVNTEAAALAESGAEIRIKHHHNSFVVSVEEAIRIIAESEEYAGKQAEAYDRMYATPLDGEALAAYFAALTPEPILSARAIVESVEAYRKRVEQHEAARERVLTMRADLGVLHGRLGGQFAAIGAEGTVWHGYNTVTQLLGSYKGREVAYGELFGERSELNARAGALAVDLSRNSAPAQGRRVAIVVPDLPRGGDPEPSTIDAVAEAEAILKAAQPPAPAPAPLPVARTLSPADKAANATTYARNKRAGGRRFTDTDVQGDPLLRRAAESYLRNTLSHSNPFMADLARVLGSGRALTDRQIAGALNVITSDRPNGW